MLVYCCVFCWNYCALMCWDLVLVGQGRLANHKSTHAFVVIWCNSCVNMECEGNSISQMKSSLLVGFVGVC